MSDIDLLFVSHTAKLLELFGPADVSVRQHDGFAVAYLSSRNIPMIMADESERNDTEAILFTRHVRTHSGQEYRVVVCAMDEATAKQVESELLRELGADVFTVETRPDPRHHGRRRQGGGGR